MGFSKDYWDKNYSKLSEMDCIFNAKEHCKYLKAMFELEYIDVNSVIDFGAGYGHLFSQMIKTFKPYRACALEPSQHAFEKLAKKKLKIGTMKLDLYQNDINSYLKKGERVFDLGICTSVFQYISSKDLKEIIPQMAKQVKYLYLTVPIDKELDRQKLEYNFKDDYAIRRSRKAYLNLFKNYFAIVSGRVLESKYFFNESNTSFSELLFREE